MKTLANCTPREFLVQTNKIRKSVASWLELTKILEIRKRLPDAKKDASDAERREAFKEQIKRNASAMLDAILEEHPDETLEVLGHLCFIDPEDIDNHAMSELLGGFAQVLNTPEVLDFFISLVRLENLNTSDTARK